MTSPRRLSLIAVGAVAAAFVVALVAFARLPARVAMRFDLEGRPDEWGASWMLFVMPGVMAILTAVMYGFSRLALRHRPQHLSTLRSLQAAVLGIFFALNLVMVGT